MPITFDHLPAEILLEIIVKIPFDGKGPIPLSQVNRRLYHVIVVHQEKIIQQLASSQFPIAARIAHSHPVKELSSLKLLRRLALETRTVARCMREVNPVQLVDSQWTERRPLVPNSEKWLETGLHLFRGLPAKILELASLGSHMDYASEVEFCLNAIPPTDCLAMRYVSMVFMSIIYANNEVGLISYYHASPHDDRAVIRAIENQLAADEIHLAMLLNVVAIGRQDPETLHKMSASNSIHLLKLSRQASGFHDSLSQDAHGLPDTKPKKSRFWEQHITRRISGILRNWTTISPHERESIMHELQVEDGDEDRALERLKEFMLIDIDAPLVYPYDEWVLDGCST